MQTPRSTRSSVLGKRGHQTDLLSSPVSGCDNSAIPTPEQTPNPKRARTSTTLGLDGDSNKENVAPFNTNIFDPPSPSSPRAARALRRSSTTDMSTPSRSRNTPRRNASSSNLLATPATATSRLTLVTPPPTPPTSLLPIHARARALLRATCNSTAQVTGRDLERSTIHKFVTSFTQSRTPGPDTASSLYISGSPGTGKTALVNSVLRSLDVTVKIVSINCMALNNVDALWDQLLEEFDRGKKDKTFGRGKRTRGREAVETILSGLKTKCILVLDELDHIAAAFQSLVSLFSLPQSNSSTLRMIGIANTHTLTSSMAQFSLHGITSVETLHFAPYTPSQLLQILQTRLTVLHDERDDFVGDDPKKFLPVPTLTLLTKKIAAQTGDVRSLFEVLRGAIDTAVTSTIPHASAVDVNPLNTPAPVVTPTHILSALKAYVPASTKRSSSSSAPVAAPSLPTSSETVTKVRNLGLQARLVLLSILLAAKRLETGLSLAGSSSSAPKSPVKTLSHTNLNVSSATLVDIDTTQLHTYYSTVLTRADHAIFTPVSRSEFTDLLGVLETVGLTSLSSSFTAPGSVSPSKTGRRAFGRSASFGGAGKDRGQEVRMIAGIRSDEVLRGMGIDVVCAKGGEGSDIREEEIRAIWGREKARLVRDVKARGRGRQCGGNRGDTFDGATEA